MITGQKVVCIDDSFDPKLIVHYKELPKKGVTYTIRALAIRREGLLDSDSATVGVLLQEINNPPDPTHFRGGPQAEELAFRQERFRPLEETKTVGKLTQAVRNIFTPSTQTS